MKTVLLILLFAVAPWLLPIYLLVLIARRNQYSRSENDEILLPEIAPTNNLPRHFSPIVFKNIVIEAPSSNTRYTEIDEVIVSPYGIFCIERKSHRGVIMGTFNKKQWTQCTYYGRYAMPNPLHQNYKHVKALEHLLGSQLKGKVHSYVVFDNAAKIVVDSKDVFCGDQGLQEVIAYHTNQIYTLGEWGRIAKTLSIASERSDELLPQHVAEVQKLHPAHL